MGGVEQETGSTPQGVTAPDVIAGLIRQWRAEVASWEGFGAIEHDEPRRCGWLTRAETYAKCADSLASAMAEHDQVTVSRDDLQTVLRYAREFDVDDDPAMIRLSAAAEAGK